VVVDDLDDLDRGHRRPVETRLRRSISVERLEDETFRMFQIKRELTGAISCELMTTAWQIPHYFEIIRRLQVVEPFPEQVRASLAQCLPRRLSVISDGLQPTRPKSNDHRN
jgi:hypothetical protein